jgi:hypothetical protein
LITTRVTNSGLRTLQARLDRMQARVGLSNVNKRVIATEVERELWEINRADRTRGVDRRGVALVPLAPSTLARRKGKGPPLAPKGAGSRVVTEYLAELDVRPGKVEVKAGWGPILSKTGRAFLEFHILGKGYNPKRDIAGITPKGHGRLRILIPAWIRESLRRVQ